MICDKWSQYHWNMLSMVKLIWSYFDMYHLLKNFSSIIMYTTSRTISRDKCVTSVSSCCLKAKAGFSPDITCFSEPRVFRKEGIHLRKVVFVCVDCQFFIFSRGCNLQCAQQFVHQAIPLMIRRRSSKPYMKGAAPTHQTWVGKGERSDLIIGTRACQYDNTPVDKTPFPLFNIWRGSWGINISEAVHRKWVNISHISFFCFKETITTNIVVTITTIHYVNNYFGFILCVNILFDYPFFSRFTLTCRYELFTLTLPLRTLINVIYSFRSFHQEEKM